MRILALKTLSSRVKFAIIGIVVVMTVLFVGYFTVHNRRTLEQYEETSGLSLAGSLAESSSLGIIIDEPFFLEQTFQIAMDNPQLVFIAAYDAAGRLLSHASRRPLDLSLSQSEMRTLAEVPSPFVGERMGLAEGAVENFFAPVMAEGAGGELTEEMLVVEDEPGVAPNLVTVGYLRLGMSRSQLERAERTSIAISIAMGAAMLFLGILTAIVLGRRITRPLKALEEGTRSIRDGNLEATVPVLTDDELGAVARGFNTMAEALRETTVSKDYMDNIVGSMNEAMTVIGMERKITAINSATKRMLGYSAEDIVGLPVDAIFFDAEHHPLDQGAWQQMMTSALSNIEADYRTKEGHRIPVNLSAAPIVDKGGVMHGVVCIARDMREVNSLLDQLKSHASELENYQTVLLSMLDDNEKSRTETEAERVKTLAAVESMTDGLLMLDPAGRVALVNPSARMMMGLDEGAEVKAENVREMLGDLFETLTIGTAKSPGMRLVHDISLGERGERTIRIEGMGVVKGDERLGSMLVMRDITKQRQLDEAKYELISNVSHELRTPLAIISNVVSNALVGVAGDLSDKLRKNMETCHANTKRLAHIIDGLLKIATIDRGEIPIEREMCDLSKIMREVSLQFEEDAKTKGLDLKLELPDEPIEAYIDREVIREVVANLVSNALRFTAKGSVSMSAAAKDGMVEVAVSDTGVGIARDEQISVFDSFHQVGRTYGPGEKGVGLGLAISRRFIERHGGSISVASSPGKGSRFAFVIPVRPQDTEVTENGG